VRAWGTIALAVAPALGGGLAGGFDSIRAADLDADLDYLAAPELEGRDTPSIGLELAAQRIVKRFEAAGLVPCDDSAEVWKTITGAELPASGAGSADATAVRGTFLRPFRRTLPVPDEVASHLVALGDAEKTFRIGIDFVPVAGLEGNAEGELVFAGFGIDASDERYDDLAGLDLRGKIALVVEGEPAHARAFDGSEVTRAAALWRKVDDLAKAGAKAVLCVRRPPPADRKKKEKHAPDTGGRLSFRSTWADWVGAARDEQPRSRIPVLELSAACARELAGVDVLELAQKIERSLKPQRVKLAGVRVRAAGKTNEKEVPVDNVVGLVRGTDLAEEHVVVGAHYDHLGVDDRGRIGLGADDNASGTAALIEIAEAIAVAGPRRSVLFCAFAGEEDGLLGSKAFCARLPVEKARIVAMLNLDMVGRGEANEVAVLGIHQNPSFEKLLQRARSARNSGVQKIVMRQGEELFARSDHYSFHQLGVPALFFFEGLPIERNKDYHTWRDTLDLVDRDKVLHTARLAFNTTWLLSTDDERPPPPRD
jgi:hypothetical protein